MTQITEVVGIWYHCQPEQNHRHDVTYVMCLQLIPFSSLTNDRKMLFVDRAAFPERKSQPLQLRFQLILCLSHNLIKLYSSEEEDATRTIFNTLNIKLFSDASIDKRNQEVHCSKPWMKQLRIRQRFLSGKDMLYVIHQPVDFHPVWDIFTSRHRYSCKKERHTYMPNQNSSM